MKHLTPYVPESLFVRVILVLVIAEEGLRLVLLLAEPAGVVLLHGGHAALDRDRLQLELSERPRPHFVPLYVRPGVGLLVEGLSAQH